MADLIESSLDPSREVLVVPPWVDTEKIKPLESSLNPYLDKFVNKNDFVVLYSGNMGHSHDIDSVLRAAEILQGKKNIKFIFIGEGDKKNDIETFVQKKNLNNISLFHFQPEDMLPFTLTLADISIVSLDEGMESLMIPSKLFSYLSAGSAIISISNENSELSDIINSGSCGLIVKPGNPDILANSIFSLYNDRDKLEILKLNSRELAVSKYTRKVVTEEFYRHLNEAGL